MTPVSGRDVVGDDPVAALARELGLGVRDDVLGLGRKADDQARPLGLAMRDGRQDVGVLDQRQRRRSPPCLLLDLLRAGSRDPPVGDRGGEDRESAGSACSTARACRARSRPGRS